MTFLDAVLLGIIQGITEFLPVSSTGHLILLRDFLNSENSQALAFDAVLHLATALAIIVYFRKELLLLLKNFFSFLQGKGAEEEQKILFFILSLGTLPAVFLGLFLEESIETTFRYPLLVAGVLITGSVFFIFAEKIGRHYKEKKPLSFKRGLALGFFQVLALIPGMSRSGSIIAGGLLLGLKREVSARTAFLLGIPIMLGAGGKKLYDLGNASLHSSEWLFLGLGAFTAFFVGILSIHYLLLFLRKYSLLVFAYYRIILALIVILGVILYP
jgi:undecaprenyl-diphosphatase